MEKEAEALNFEKAVVIRDQIRGLNSLNADQKVSLPDDRVSRDAIALAGNNQIACVQLFQIRAGKLVGRLGFIAEIPDLGTAENKELGSILQRVLESHYQIVESVEIPTEIIVQNELPEGNLMASLVQKDSFQN